jgi:hypothetical protein
MAWPTTSNPRTEFVTLRLTADEAADLDWLMARTGTHNRSAALRDAFGRVVASERRKSKKAQPTQQTQPQRGSS